MAAIPNLKDPTLEAADAVIEQLGNAPKPRPYLGMSAIGDDCERKLWYQFRWAAPVVFDAITHKKFEDGHRTEDLVIARLRRVPGIEIYSVDPETGHQFALSDLGGHFRGHMDFVVKGLIQAPKTWHVGEVKATEETAKIDKARATYGEKDALQQWHPTYYAQAQAYMGYTGMERHYLVAATPGGRHWVSLRTNFAPDEFLRIKAKAARIVFAANQPERLSDKPDYYKCRWCSFAPQCHEGKASATSCRTCLHVTPEENGTWTCARFKKVLSTSEQREGCPAHLFIPSLVDAEQIDAGDDWVEYRDRDGRVWRDGVK